MGNLTSHSFPFLFGFIQYPGLGKNSFVTRLRRNLLLVNIAIFVIIIGNLRVLKKSVTAYINTYKLGL